MANNDLQKARKQLLESERRMAALALAMLRKDSKE